MKLATSSKSNNPVEGDPFIVASEIMHTFMGLVERVARHVGTVLIVGETGTGKEAIAHAIHKHSLRSNKPFVDINCAALPENLVESELFGYEKGAFSGADIGKPGLFELAHLGTIFLDEIGELDLKAQVKLLRIMDGAPYYRLGGHRMISADVRVVAATNRNLKEEVIAGRFRKDLYHRLAQFELYVPPLRERRDDIAPLTKHFLDQEGNGHTFSADALRLLESYSWPGNVRELRNFVNKVMISATGRDIAASQVRLELANARVDDSGQVDSSELGTRLDALEAQMKAHAIVRALEHTGGHRGQAAAHLGISRRTLSRKLREYGFSSQIPAPVALGSLSEEERKNFRAELRVSAVVVTAEGQEVTCTIANLSEKGMGIEGLTTALSHRCALRIRFRFPDSDTPLEAHAHLAWTGTDGRAGIAFTAVDPMTCQQIRRWVDRKMEESGWTVTPDSVSLAK